MTDHETSFIEVSQLRIGHYVYIDLGWMAHPFPLNNFKIRSAEQIRAIQGLGLQRVRYSPSKSDPEPVAALPLSTLSQPPASADAGDDPILQAQREEEKRQRRERQELLSRQRSSLRQCERQFSDAAKVFRQISDSAHNQPKLAFSHCENLVNGLLGNVLGEEESCIRLLSEQVGERTGLHSINVTVISLLLGRAVGLGASEMFDLGVGALLHDIGKIDLPDRLRWREEYYSPAELLAFQEHVAHGVNIGRKMELPAGALLVIGLHHEHADGSGYPKRLTGDRLSAAAKIVALVNHYDNLCNPNNPAAALTPHEALSLIFAQLKSRYDSAILGSFIRMMGIYPPGSVVQLNDQRFALVVSVNSARPLKPRVIIHQPEIPRDEALVVDLETLPDLGIRRSLKPLQLPRATIDYLSPRERICYFFERARDAVSAGGEA